MKVHAAIAVLALLLLPACGSGKVKEYKVKVVKEYPHNVSSYTQGLFFHDGKLYESTGEYGNSTFRTVSLETGEALKKMNFDRKYFIEGSTILDGILYILTWNEKVVFRYDATTLKYSSTLGYRRQGWGLTTDGKQLIASDGSSRIYFLDSSLKTLRSIQVTLNGSPVRYLNELEWIDGRIWANVYTTDTIVIINPSNGVVEATVDCTGLLPKSLRTKKTDVLNGIAVSGKKIYLTGKRWPRLYEVELISK